MRNIRIRILALVAGAALALSSAAAMPSETHWSLRPVRSVDAPPDDSGWAYNEIDRFILAGLKEAGLEPNPAADRRTLLRRAYLGVIGLPPTPEQVEAFLNDPSPAAFAKVIDQLLASEKYGERWGRHWLDLARYADTSGDGADAPIPEAHLYRDYVLDAFNRDMPYDQFIIEQIAGDLLPGREPERARERIIATGFVALTRRFNNREYGDMHLVIDNTLGTIGQSMLGLTIQCARCHDHKYDPISISDYYGLYGYFSSTQYPHAGTEHGRKRKNFVPLPGGGVAYAVTDKHEPGEIGDAPLLKLGNPRARGDQVPRGFLPGIDTAAPEIPEGQSGRLELAHWIASPENPLTARVMANRIWQYHFGKGIVPTSSNFGLQGKPPTHPELLDWLAAQFVQSGWSIKQMHRLILLSRTYQLSSDRNLESEEIDPLNERYWRHPRRRLESEPLRDSVLFVSGRLRPGNPGPHPFPQPNENDEYNFTQHRPFLQDYDHDHRTVYLPSRRLGRHPFMETFNGPDPNECTAHREVSTVPLQSLFWMNSRFIRDNARDMARRLLDQRHHPEERVALAYQLAYARPPTGEEKSEAVAYIAAYMQQLADAAAEDHEHRAWTSFCRVLLASNEFVYLE